MQIADNLVVKGTLTASGVSNGSASDALTAAGTNQATGLQLTATYNNVTTAAAGTGVNLPASSAGLQVVVLNNGANPLAVYPLIGATDTVNGYAATIGTLIPVSGAGTFICTAAGAWTALVDATKYAAFNTASNTTSFTATAAQITGGLASVDFAVTGTLGSGQNITLPTVAATTLAMGGAIIGSSYRLRIINQSSANFAWTVVTATGWTLTGTMTIAQNTWREFVVTLNTLTTATLQSVAVGTYS